MDVPGFMVGSKVEHEGIIRHGANAAPMASGRCPSHRRLRQGYGAGYYVMAGRAYEPDLLVGGGCGDQRHGREGMVASAGKKPVRRQQPRPRSSPIVDMLQEADRHYRVAGWASSTT